MVHLEFGQTYIHWHRQKREKKPRNNTVILRFPIFSLLCIRWELMELCISLPPLGGNSLENLRSEILIKKTIDDKNSEDAHFMFSAFRQTEKNKKKRKRFIYIYIYFILFFNAWKNATITIMMIMIMKDKQNKWWQWWGCWFEDDEICKYGLLQALTGLYCQQRVPRVGTGRRLSTFRCGQDVESRSDTFW